MTIESILDTARNDVLIENTGQTVLKHLRALEDRRSLVMSRWIWELLQNARDAGAGRSVSVSIVAASGTLSISHNGKPFTAKEIAHLIYHGSTKQDADGPVRFGTGFISTHLINPDVT